MAYLARNVDVRLDPALLLEGARSIVMVADQYATRNDPPDDAGGGGRIARYARGRDYHKEIKSRLHKVCDALREEHPRAEFRSFADTAPVLERELAQRAGLGWVAKHTLIIDPDLGSYLLLGGFATTLQLAPPADQPAVTDHCGACTRCIEACPTDAISPYSVDARRCISYLTIERRREIDDAYHEPIGDWIFGCDICQEVCPHNSPRPSREVGEAREAYRSSRHALDPLSVLRWEASDRTTELRASAMKRATLDMLKRNALIVAGNQAQDGNVQARVAEIAADESESDMVRETARSVLRRWSAG
jgi:epoxyqueuosine reductase